MNFKDFFIKHYNKILVIVTALFVLTLYSFPEPSTNFLAYVITIITYITIILLMRYIKVRN